MAARSHRKGPGSIPRGAKCIFLVATELAYKSNSAEGHSLECLVSSPGISEDIPRDVWRHSPECFTTFPRIFGDIPRNIWRHSRECLRTFAGMFEDIPWNFGNIPWNIIFLPIPRVFSRIPFPIPVFLFLYIAKNLTFS